MIEPAKQLDPLQQRAKIARRSLMLQRSQIVIGYIDQLAVAAGLEQHQRAQPLDQIACELAQIRTLGRHTSDRTTTRNAAVAT